MSLERFLYILKAVCAERQKDVSVPDGRRRQEESGWKYHQGMHMKRSKVRFDTITEDNYSWLTRSSSVFHTREVRNYAEYLHRSENRQFAGSKFATKIWCKSASACVRKEGWKRAFLLRKKPARCLHLKKMAGRFSGDAWYSSANLNTEKLKNETPALMSWKFPNYRRIDGIGTGICIRCLDQQKLLWCADWKRKPQDWRYLPCPEPRTS